MPDLTGPTGWKPLVLWYVFWGVALFVSVMYGLLTGNIGGALIALAASGGCFLYSRYLYRGGKHRVWFVIW